MKHELKLRFFFNEGYEEIREFNFYQPVTQTQKWLKSLQIMYLLISSSAASTIETRLTAVLFFPFKGFLSLEKVSWKKWSRQ